MVTLQILVLSFQVRILVAQLKNRSNRFGFLFYSASKKVAPKSNPTFIKYTLCKSFQYQPVPAA